MGRLICWMASFAYGLRRQGRLLRYWRRLRRSGATVTLAARVRPGVLLSIDGEVCVAGRGGDEVPVAPVGRGRTHLWHR